MTTTTAGRATRASASGNLQPAAERRATTSRVIPLHTQSASRIIMATPNDQPPKKPTVPGSQNVTGQKPGQPSTRQNVTGQKPAQPQAGKPAPGKPAPQKPADKTAPKAKDAKKPGAKKAAGGESGGK